jgi:hypothetical protein
MPTLTVTDLRDPAPPIPGPAHRAAVAVRAQRLTRQRRFAQIGGAVAVVAVLAVGGVAIASAGSNQAGHVVVQTASVTGNTTSPPVSTLTVTLTGNDKTVTVDADPSGTFTVSDLPPGKYLLEWTYETSGPQPTGDVDIGTALSAGRLHVDLSSGNNTVSIPLTH